MRTALLIDLTCIAGGVLFAYAVLAYTILPDITDSVVKALGQ